MNIGAFSEYFDSNGVTIILELTQDLLINVAYNISVVPDIPVRNIDSTSFDLTVSYNTHVNVSISATAMCGESTIYVELYYG